MELYSTEIGGDPKGGSQCPASTRTQANIRDGPALRALTLIPYAHFLLDRGNPFDRGFVTENLYDPALIRAAGKVIKNDLEEVAAGWFESGFDLWEEM